MLSGALKAIVDLLKLRKDVKKIDLEIEKLEREQKIARAFIQPATSADIERYNPATRERIELARRLELEERERLAVRHRDGLSMIDTYKPSWVVFVLLVVAILYVLYKIFA